MAFCVRAVTFASGDETILDNHEGREGTRREENIGEETKAAERQGESLHLPNDVAEDPARPTQSMNAVQPRIAKLLPVSTTSSCERRASR